MHWIDPDSVSEISGVPERFVLNRHAEADGLILVDGTEVHFPPHMADEIVAAVEAAGHRPIRLRGVRARQSGVVVTLALIFADGSRVEDRGPPEGEKKPHPRPEGRSEMCEAESTVRRLLHGGKGEVHGALLDDGAIVRFPRDAKLPVRLQVGESLAVRGRRHVSKLGAVIAAESLGESLDHLRPVEGAKPPKPPKKPKPHHPHDDHRRPAP